MARIVDHPKPDQDVVDDAVFFRISDPGINADQDEVQKGKMISISRVRARRWASGRCHRAMESRSAGR